MEAWLARARSEEDAADQCTTSNAAIVSLARQQRLRTTEIGSKYLSGNKCEIFKTEPDAMQGGRVAKGKAASVQNQHNPDFR